MCACHGTFRFFSCKFHICAWISKVYSFLLVSSLHSDNTLLVYGLAKVVYEGIHTSELNEVVQVYRHIYV